VIYRRSRQRYPLSVFYLNKFYSPSKEKS